MHGQQNIKICDCCSWQISHKLGKKPSGKETYIRVVQIALERGSLSSQERKCGGRPLFLAEIVEHFRISPCIVQLKSFFKFRNQ